LAWKTASSTSSVGAYPHVFASTIIPAAGKGRDITKGGALYHWTTPFGAGIATARIPGRRRKVVFEEGKLSMRELKQTLDGDFAGWRGKGGQVFCALQYGNDEGDVDDSRSLFRPFL
jgi:hypothetical protein